MIKNCIPKYYFQQKCELGLRTLQCYHGVKLFRNKCFRKYFIVEPLQDKLSNNNTRVVEYHITCSPALVANISIPIASLKITKQKKEFKLSNERSNLTYMYNHFSMRSLHDCYGIHMYKIDKIQNTSIFECNEHKR